MPQKKTASKPAPKKDSMPAHKMPGGHMMKDSEMKRMMGDGSAKKPMMKKSMKRGY